MTNRWLVQRGDPTTQLREEAGRIFNDSLGDLFGGSPRAGRRSLTRGGRFPAVNLWETEEEIRAEAEVPGLKMDDLEILVKGNDLIIKGERKHEDREGVRYHRRERGTGSFCSIVRLPAEIDLDKVEATLDTGVLAVRMPKEPKALARKIEVKVRSN